MIQTRREEKKLLLQEINPLHCNKGAQALYGAQALCIHFVYGAQVLCIV